jgi:hypothetical protein
MCYNKEVSLTTYITGILLSFVLYFYGNNLDKHIALFCIVFIQIQLAEYFMWKDQKCGKTNHNATVFAHIVLILQPISLLLGGLIFNTFYIPKILTVYFLVICLIPLINAIKINLLNKRRLCSLEEKTGQLEWRFANGKTNDWSSIITIIYFTFLLATWFFVKDTKKGFFMFVITFSLLIYSSYKNTESKHNIFEQWESKWCFISVITPLLIIIYNFIEQML